MPMSEVWLQSNRRIVALGLLPVGALAGIGCLLLVAGESTTVRLLALGLIGVGALLGLGLAQQFRQPRISYRDGNVLFHLRGDEPIAVPREVVEAFFLGQGPSFLPHLRGRQPESVNLVARLSQKAPQWMHIDVKPALGHWCDGYVTIRGTWCEPLTGEVIRRINARLRELRTEALAAEARADAPALATLAVPDAVGEA